jgi:hypothetical protein
MRRVGYPPYSAASLQGITAGAQTEEEDGRDEIRVDLRPTPTSEASYCPEYFQFCTSQTMLPQVLTE